jgi:uncharacterized membrane protein
LLTDKEPAKGIQRITRHPFLWGVALWSFTHLVLKGDLASVIFFGSFLILAIAGPFSMDRKRKKAFADAWDRFAALTSNVPFVAIVEGRNWLKIRELGSAAWLETALAVPMISIQENAGSLVSREG